MNQTIPSAHRVARYCRPSSLDNGRVTGRSFSVRPKEAYVSINWIERLKLQSIEEVISELWRIYSQKLQVNSSAKIAVLKVGATIDFVKKESLDNRVLTFENEPTETDPSHSGIYGYLSTDNLIAELIAQTVSDESIYSRSEKK